MALRISKGGSRSWVYLFRVHGRLRRMTLGTFPAMLLVAGLGDRLRGAWRRRGVDLAGALIVLLGLITLARGVVPFGAHGHLS